MPHALKEVHLDDICVNCKKPQGSDKEIFFQHHKIYESITCINCGYETIKLREETQFFDRHRV